MGRPPIDYNKPLTLAITIGVLVGGLVGFNYSEGQSIINKVNGRISNRLERCSDLSSS